MTSIPNEEWEPPADVKPWMVCAANRSPTGFIVTGVRHNDHFMFRQMTVYRNGYTGGPPLTWEQGFIDQWGRFYQRDEAMKAVLDSGQPFNAERQGGITHELYSEGLY